MLLNLGINIETYLKEISDLLIDIALQIQKLYC